MRRARVLAGLWALAVLFSVYSCVTVDNTIGSAYAPTSQDISIKVDQFDLPVTMAMADGLQSSLDGSATVGTITTETFGTFSSAAAISISPSFDSLVIGDNPVFKEMYASMAVSENLTLSDDQKNIIQNIYVHQLNVELDSTRIYSNSISDKDVRKESAIRENVIYTGDDQVRFFFTEEFAKPIFDLTYEQLDSARLFMKAFYGLYIHTEPVEGIKDGGRLISFDLSNSFAYLTYTSTNYEGRRRDTTITFALGAYNNVNRYESSSAPLVREDPSLALYMESLNGVKPCIRGTEMKKLVDGWLEEKGLIAKNVLVTRATLEFPFEYSGDPSDYDVFPANLFACRRFVSDGKSYYQPVDDVYLVEQGSGAANYSLYNFKPDVATYIQEIMKREPESISSDDDLWIMPIISITDATTSEYIYRADTYYYTQCILNGTAAERHPVLRITYAVLH